MLIRIRENCRSSNSLVSPMRSTITALIVAAGVLHASGGIPVKDPQSDLLLGLPDLRQSDKTVWMEDYTKFSQSLDVGGFALDYPKTIRDLRSNQRTDRLRALAVCRESEDLRSIPFIVAQIYYTDPEVQTWAGVALDTLVSHYELRRRDMSHPERVTLLPRGSAHIDLRPLRWIVVEMFYSGDSSLQSQASTMAGYIGLSDLEPMLRAVHKSRHPATYTAIEHAFDLLHISYEKRSK